jgi:hypothetical protein
MLCYGNLKQLHLYIRVVWKATRNRREIRVRCPNYTFSVAWTLYSSSALFQCMYRRYAGSILGIQGPAISIWPKHCILACNDSHVAPGYSTYRRRLAVRLSIYTDVFVLFLVQWNLDLYFPNLSFSRIHQSHYMVPEYILFKIWGFHGGDYEECRLLRYQTQFVTQQTHYVCATEPGQLMLCKIWGFHGGDYEECRLLGYQTQFVTHSRHITSVLQSPAS